MLPSINGEEAGEVGEGAMASLIQPAWKDWAGEVGERMLWLPWSNQLRRINIRNSSSWNLFYFFLIKHVFQNYYFRKIKYLTGGRKREILKPLPKPPAIAGDVGGAALISGAKEREEENGRRWRPLPQLFRSRVRRRGTVSPLQVLPFSFPRISKVFWLVLQIVCGGDGDSLLIHAKYWRNYLFSNTFFVSIFFCFQVRILFLTSVLVIIFF